MIYGATISLGAFLLFLIQPIAAKIILPWFGGSAAVWSTCLLFFQAVLLLGYVYASWLDRRLTPRLQGRLHLGLLALAVLALPIALSVDWTPRRASGDPAFAILALLAGTIGLPYLLLSTTAPLLQAWYRDAGRGAVPYRFYAISNAASLLALLSYPFVIEPELSRRTQAIVWLLLFSAYVLLTARLALARPSSTPAIDRGPADAPRPSWSRYLFWIALAASASTLLISVTSHLTQNVAPIPLLWVVPLSAYLLTFVICFSHDRAYGRLFWLPLAVLALCSMSQVLYGLGDKPPLDVSLIAFNLDLFVCCMFCHGELARSKPHARYLTGFYVACALGGAIGSVFTALVAPRIFAGHYELACGLIACALLILVVIYRQVAAGRWHSLWLSVAGAFVALLVVFLVHGIRESRANSRVLARNFYGAVRIAEGTTGTGEAYRQLQHGTIIHGSQFLSAAKQCEPTTYYSRNSGVGEILGNPTPGVSRRVGIIGLGAGTLAAYGGKDDHFTFYEINPIVAGLANTEFAFLRECGTRADVAMGDARLTLEHQPPQRFDALIVDAFSGDAVPVHLLTTQAFEVYFRHLKPTGVLAVHISNTYLDLQPVVEHLARALDKDLRLVSGRTADELDYGSVWALVASRGRLDALEEADGVQDLDVPHDEQPVWTDDFSSVWPILKWR